MKTDAEIFVDNIMRIKPEEASLSKVQDKAGYNRHHLYNLKIRNWNITVEHIRCYAKALKVDPLKLLEGMFDEN